MNNFASKEFLILYSLLEQERLFSPKHVQQRRMQLFMPFHQQMLCQDMLESQRSITLKPFKMQFC